MRLFWSTIKFLDQLLFKLQITNQWHLTLFQDNAILSYTCLKVHFFSKDLVISTWAQRWPVFMKHFPRTAICLSAEKKPQPPKKKPQNKKCTDGIGIPSLFMEPLSVSLWICGDVLAFTSGVSSFSPGNDTVIFPSSGPLPFKEIECIVAKNKSALMMYGMCW